MFGQTSFTVDAPRQSSFAKMSSKMQSPLAARRRPPPSPSRTPPNTSRPPLSASKQGREIEVSERFKNPAYNRQPSPKGRFLTVDRDKREVAFGTSRDRSPSIRERVRPSSHKPAATHGSVAGSRSDIMRQKMETQVTDRETRQTLPGHQRARPKTTENKGVEHQLASESSNFEDKVFLAVKEVLSRAVIERGKIDENNISTIINDMKNRLRGDEHFCIDSDDENARVDVKLKRSTTNLNVDSNLASKNKVFPISKAKPLPGIVRRNISEPMRKTQNIYKKIYNKEDSSPVNKYKNKNVYSNNDDEPIVYVDVPDSDYSNFNAMVRKEELLKLEQKKKLEEAKQLEESLLREQQLTKSTDNNNSFGDSKNKEHLNHNFIESNVGDCQLDGSCQPYTFWKTGEDVKLQNYIESLIRQMNDQLNCKAPSKNFEDQIETEETVCKSFCVCKVCVSNKTSASRKTLNEQPSISNVKGKSHSELKLRNGALNDSIKLKQSKVLSNDSNRESHFKILQRNTNFQPESKLNVSSRYVMGGSLDPEEKHFPNSKVSFMTVPPEEAGEDLYLQRRVQKTPVKRRMSTRI